MRRLIVLVAAVLVAGVCGVAYAQSSPGSSAGVIYACVVKPSGVPRIVSGPGECRRGESELSWNQQSSAGTAGAAWYSSRPLGTAVAVPVTPPPNGTPGAMITVTVPNPPSGGGYLMNVTFGLRNTGPVDAELVCNVGNIMAHQFFVPVSDQTAGQENLGGVYGSDTRTYTITGVYTGGGSVGLFCGITSWTTQGSPTPQTPAVSLMGAVLTAQRIDQLTMQPPAS